MNKKIFYDLAILAAVLVLGVLGYKLSPLLTPQTDLSLPLTDCRLDKDSCQTELPEGGRLVFSLTPRPIPSLKTLTLEARISGITVDKVEVDFAGVDMKMGFNRPLLAPGSSPGLFTGEGNLPVCTTGTMDWQATVLLSSGGRTIAIPYRFTTAAPEAH